MTRLLLVDDNQDLADLMREFLVHSGYEVAQASSGPEALKALGVEPSGPCRADLVLLDQFMPGMSGEEVHRRMEADAKTQGLPVIFLSGTSELPPSGPKVRALKKPFEPQQVLKLIKELLP